MLTRSNIIAFLAYSRRWESKTKKIFQINKKLLKKCREVYSNLKLILLLCGESAIEVYCYLKRIRELRNAYNEYRKLTNEY